jgi:tRNA-binding protein
MEQITWSDFEKVELRVGTILSVEDFPEAKKPAYKVTADFGELGIKKSSVQITSLYKKEGLINKQIVGVVNFPVKQIGPFVSEFLTTGFYRSDGSVVLVVPDKEVPNGVKIG